MKEMLKKNQLIIVVLALMLITAGYLNYTAKDHSIETSVNAIEMAALGDATLVDALPIEEAEEVETANNTLKEAEKELQNYFASSKLDRDKMYSQMLEAYQKIIEKSNITAEQKSISEQEIAKINQTKNAIMIAENLIKTKGFEDVVIFVNNDSVSVIIKAKSLKQDEIAKIQNIIERELKVGVDNINISNKE